MLLVQIDCRLPEPLPQISPGSSTSPAQDRMQFSVQLLACRLATPMRTPRITGASGEDRIMAEAQNLARLQVCPALCA